MDTWNESVLATAGYQLRKIALTQQMQAALGAGDRDRYYYLQREFWDLYYKTFPPFLPPTIDNGEKYNLYLEVCAVSSVESGFDPKWHEYAARQQQLQNAVQYLVAEGRRVAEGQSFFRLAEFFVGMTREGMRIFYENPRYAVMHELLPQQVHLKMKKSMLVQAWLPYLTDTDADKLLKMLGFSNEYEEIARPAGRMIECGSCGSGVFACEGAYKVFCEKCRKTIVINGQFFCMSCGAPNEVPDNPGKPVGCTRCGIANRLIKPFFG
jgi:hypothetical protein